MSKSTLIDQTKTCQELAAEFTQSKRSFLERLLQSVKERRFPFRNLDDEEREYCGRMLQVMINGTLEEASLLNSIGTQAEQLFGIRSEVAEKVSKMIAAFSQTENLSLT